MATEYVKITITNYSEGNPTWPVPPEIIYAEFVWHSTYREIAQKDVEGTTYRANLLMWDPTSIPYFSYEAFFFGNHVYAILHGNDNDAIAAAYASGILTGTYTGSYGATWDIEHLVHNDDILLPSGEGGEVGLDFTYGTPLEQTGGEPPNKVQNPFPTDDATNIQLVLPQLTWNAG